MWNWPSCRFNIGIVPWLLVLGLSWHVHHTEIAIVMILGLLLHYWYLKLHWLDFIGPQVKGFITIFTNIVRSPWLTLITNLHTKLSLICSFGEILNIEMMLFYSIFTTYVAENVRVVVATFTLKIHV